MLRVLALLAAVCGAQGLRGDPGGPGNAAFIGYKQGFYLTDFPMPETTLTVELWTKLLPVSRLRRARSVSRSPAMFCVRYPWFMHFTGCGGGSPPLAAVWICNPFVTAD